jgi:hypothetical protein
MGVLTRKRVPAAPAFAELTRIRADHSGDYAACCLNFSASAGLPTNPIT